MRVAAPRKATPAVARRGLIRARAIELSNAVELPGWRGAQWIVAAALAVAVLAAPAHAVAPPATSASAQSPKAVAPIDVNSASRTQLKTLPGIGDAEAERIIAGRPYRSKADLVEHDVIPLGVYVSIKGRIVAKQKVARSAKGS